MGAVISCVSLFQARHILVFFNGQLTALDSIGALHHRWVHHGSHPRHRRHPQGDYRRDRILLRHSCVLFDVWKTGRQEETDYECGVMEMEAFFC